MRFCLTGVTGAIGVPLVAYLLARQHHVTVLLNPGSLRGSQIMAHDNLDILHVALSDYSDLAANFNCDVFVHMAWSGGTMRDSFAANFESCGATIAAVKLAKRLGCATFISTGSQAECAAYSEVMDEYTECRPGSAFGLAKYAALKASGVACKSDGLRFVWLRIFSVYGEYDRADAMLMQLLRASLLGRDVRLSAGRQFWDFLHSDDVVTAMYELAMNECAQGIYVIGSGDGMRLVDYFNIISGVLDRDLSSSIGTLKSAATYDLRCCPDRLKHDCDWQPTISFRRGVQRVAESIKQDVVSV
jgi:UDP-glucose 4-epimerase